LTWKEHQIQQEELVGISDCEYRADQETRMSDVGRNICFCSELIAWKSKPGNSRVTKEIMFVKQVFQNMGYGFRLPIQVRVESNRAFYLSKKYS
jgi:hypothetical protein